MSQQPPRGPKLRPSYDRDLVLAAAVHLFNKQGYDATSMGDIADHLSVTRAALYYHVPSKQELLRLALENALQPLESILHAPEARAGTARQRLEFVLRRTIAVQVEHLPSMALLRRLRGNSELEINALNRRRAFEEGISTLTSLARQEGSLRIDVDPRTAARLLIGAVSAAGDSREPLSGAPSLRLADDILTVVFEGIRARQ